MLAAIVILLSFLGIYIRQIAAVLGGIGFGTFIDELGKFITSDNNYFFQPTVAILYFLFLFLFIAFRYLERHREMSEKEYLMNALELLGEGVQNDMDAEEKKTFLSFLKNANVTSTHAKITKHLIALSDDLEEVQSSESGIVKKFLIQSQTQFNRFVQSPLMGGIILGFFIINALLYILSVVLIALAIFTGREYTIDLPSQYISLAFGEIISTTASAVLIIIGVLVLKFSRYTSYLFFKYSILVSILITQFFVFYREQVSAVFGLLLNVFILLTLNYMISIVKSKRSKEVNKYNA